MMLKKNKFAFALTMIAIMGMATKTGARPNITSGQNPNDPKGSGLKGTASSATCRPAESAIDLDINNIRARLMTGGDMWWDIGTSSAAYEVPKGSRKSSLFAGSVWIGGFDAQGQLKVAAQTYRQDGNDYWPGPLDVQTANTDQSTCSEWDKFWKVNKSDVNKFRELKDKSAAEGDAAYDAIVQWPAKGNEKAIGRNLNNLNIPKDRDFAPFVDVDNNGMYNPLDGGDYPGIDANTPLPGDQYIWWVFNDKGNTKAQSKTEGIGIEVQASAFAYSTKDFLNDATFYNYRLINRGSLTLDSTFIATWTDADLGYYKDDYIGCDVGRGLGILYNGKSVDGSGQVNSYGDKVPMVGVDFFQGPFKTYDSAGKTVSRRLSMEAFTYYNNDFSIIGNPNNGTQIYNYMTGSILNGQRFSNDFVGPNIQSKGYGSGAITKFVYTGDPKNPSEWSECTCNNPPDDRRFVHSSGPFKLLPGVVNDITIGAVWVADVGGCPNTSFAKIRVADDAAQNLFNDNFKTIEGPEAPRLVIREMDRKLVMYLINDSTSTNFQEKYGYDTAKKYRVASSKAAKYVKSPDSLYKFEGYRVFQLKNSTVQAAQIFNDKGEVNTDLAIEVFQCDVKNGVKRIINYDKSTDISDTTFVPIVKVNGADSGIKHSFEITQDRFATGNDKRIVNYRNYYFVAIAYAYNNFAPFNPRKPDSTQDVVYLESQHGANSSPIAVTIGMPNPANGDMGTVLNADYNSGVIIKRMEGTGNGGNILDISDESEKEAVLGTNYQSVYTTYKPGFGPVNVKVVDPVRIKPADWELYITGNPQPDASKGLDSFSTWKLVNVTNGDTIYSESVKGISIPNEQILEKYGLSVNIKQVKRPGDDQINGNGYITSTVTFQDPSKPWLAGVNDAEGREYSNWIRSGNNTDTLKACNYNDNKYDTVLQAYEHFFPNNTALTGSWTAYTMGSDEAKAACAFGTVRTGTQVGLSPIPSVDIVFTSDKSKWTRSAVIEMQDDKELAEGKALKFTLREHSSWNGDYDEAGRPTYASDPADKGMSLFPGYAINQETGERLNIVFGEDSWLKSYNGADMLWNPTTEGFTVDRSGNLNRIYGGKHFVYILNSKYDGCKTFVNDIVNGVLIVKTDAYKKFMYTGMPLLNEGSEFTSIAQGFIPTETRIRIRVDRPYANYATGDPASMKNGGNPFYTFSTKALAPSPLSDNPNADKQALLDKIQPVPNPYYGYTGYESNRLDTRVRIINLPRKATISIYSLDGVLIKKLEKDNPNVSYIDWDIRNTKGLPVASGMYLMHVNADGIGETVLRWFGAMRPLELTTY